ncbi:MoaD/ThiS family protein [Pedobacter sp. SD-b]|uniref:MoaD/ThiS family protein n=1 Tax=Pedobacter segetis TaxID=2793069 RepID=A0ABS1BNI9_9SPHI|nr:MoaD/ThiS family protein [Pedobacter segetis]MBK0384467.1 MoaD/ThiS family protein [Pedobacter segetis]
MKIRTYAILKDYFSDITDITFNAKHIAQIKDKLEEINPSAKAILNISRFAVDDAFVALDYELKGDETISVIPPSSGG